MITDKRLQQALTYLAETDEEAAAAKACYVGLDEQKKTIYGIEFSETTGPIEQRKAQAYASSRYEDHLNKLEDALYKWELIRNKRLTEQMIVEVWRSLNANRRKGNL